MGRFRTDPEARKLLVALETGDARRGASSSSASRSCSRLSPERPGRRAVRRRASPTLRWSRRCAWRAQAGIRTALGLELLGRAPLPARHVRGAVRRRRDLRRRGHPQARAAHVRVGAERAGVAPEACVYVDDLPFNLMPAEELGMADDPSHERRDHGSAARSGCSACHWARAHEPRTPYVGNQLPAGLGSRDVGPLPRRSGPEALASTSSMSTHGPTSQRTDR